MLAVGAGAALWFFAGPWWLLGAASGYLAFLVGVKLLVDRGRRARERARGAAAGR